MKYRYFNLDTLAYLPVDSRIILLQSYYRGLYYKVFNVDIEQYPTLLEASVSLEDPEQVIEPNASYINNFPMFVRDHATLCTCEHDCFLMDLICSILWPNKKFSIIELTDPIEEHIIHYTVIDETNMIYDIQLWYIPHRQKRVDKMVITNTYRTTDEKKKLLDNYHGDKAMNTIIDNIY